MSQIASFDGLTDRAAEVLSVGRPERRLTQEQVFQLRLQMKLIAEWADKVPEKTQFLFVNWKPTLVVPRVEGYSRIELGIAAYLQPLHSQLCVIAVQVLWKANQIIRALGAALDSGDLVVAATLARTLVEAVAAFGYESWRVSELWRTRSRQPAPDLDSLQAFAAEAKRMVGQILFGTKVKNANGTVTGIERTNILTLIDKAEKLSENPGLRTLYELLCDTVHPSVGSNRCFWTEEPSSDDTGVFTFVAERAANGALSDLPFTIGFSTLWAVTWLGWMWGLFDRTRKDLCLTARIYALPASYYGIVRPGVIGQHCPCGSTRLTEACPHHFGRSD